MTASTAVSTSYADAPALAQQLAADGMPADAVLIYNGRRNKVAFTADGHYCIKAYRVPGMVKRVIYGNFRIPKARRAWLNAHTLIELGFDTPEPVCMVECHCGPQIGRTYYVCLAYHGWNDLRKVEEHPDFERLVPQLAAFILALHRKGVLMKDLSQGNVLWRKDDDGAFKFALIDINRMEFDVYDSERQLINFGAVLDTEAGILTLAHHYAALRGDYSYVEKAVAAFRDKQAAIARKRKLKKVIKSLTGKQ